MRQLIYIVSAILLFSAGWLSHLLLRGEDTVTYHWKKLSEYKEHMENPSNSRSSMGFRYTSLPFDNTPHLEALVAAGEIQKRSILIPGLPVSRENTKEWMELADDPEVLEARSQGDYDSGEVPLSFTIWYRPTFERRIEEWIEELNKRASKKSLEATH